MSAANIKNSEFVCKHNHSQNKKLASIQVGDAHLFNCNVCGAFLPKSGSVVIRARHRQSQQMKLYSSDILRTIYSQCQQRSQKPENVIKISASYQEVRSLIIDWLCEVTESLRLSSRSMFHAVTILDKFLSTQLKQRGIDMQQN